MVTQGITDEDERALALFMNPNRPAARRTLADVIAEKMKEKEAEIATVASGTVRVRKHADENVHADEHEGRGTGYTCMNTTGCTCVNTRGEARA